MVTYLVVNEDLLLSVVLLDNISSICQISNQGGEDEVPQTCQSKHDLLSSGLRYLSLEIRGDIGWVVHVSVMAGGKELLTATIRSIDL